MRRWLHSIQARWGEKTRTELFTALAEAAPDCIQIVNPDGTRRFINCAGIAMLGAESYAQIARYPVWEFIVPADRPRAKDWLEKVLHGESVGSIELRIKRLDGAIRHVESRGAPLRAPSGQITGALVITRDVSEQHRIHADLIKITRLYRMLSQVNQLILRRPGRKVLLERIAEIMLQEGEFGLVWIGLADSDGKIQQQVSSAAMPCSQAMDLGRLTCLAEQIISQGKLFLANTLEDIGDANLRAASARCGMEALALVPIRVAQKAVGALKVCAPKEGFFEPETLNLLQELAADIGYALEFEATSIARQLQEQELAFLAYRDPLTLLPNRRRLLEHLAQTIAHAQRRGTGFALLLMDLDRFKDVNDSFGHSIGDRLLVQVTTHFQQRLRATDLLARLGGDEFALVLEDLHTPEDAGRVATDLVTALAPWRLTEDVEVPIGISCGIAIFPDHGKDPGELLQHADAALYQAKALGRGQFCYFSHELTERTRLRLHLAHQLRQALQENQLVLYFQAQLDQAGKLVGAEALVRWQNKGKLIPPAEFIPIAEQTGLINALDLWVLKELCRQGRAWLDAGLGVPTLAANLSPHALHRSQLDQQVAEILKDTGFPAKLLAVELTESALMEQESNMAEILHSVRQLEVSLALDDFGTGYSSLSRLKQLPIDLVKIDKGFVDSVPDVEEDCQIVSAIIAMSHALGIKVLAEGVETEAQRQFLAQQGCDLYQGYLYSVPLPAEAFEKRWLRN